MFKIAAIALMLAGSFSSCTPKGSNENEPSKLILGKWELIERRDYTTGFELRAVEPNGNYIEFLSNGTVHVYIATEDKFYMMTYEIDENILCYYPEKTFDQGRLEYKYEITKNRLKMTLYQGHTLELHSGHIFIYQQKK